MLCEDVASNTSIGRKRREEYFVTRMRIKESRLERYRKGSEMYFSIQVELHVVKTGCIIWSTQIYNKNWMGVGCNSARRDMRGKKK
jgi:hypothetical protein